MKRIIIAITLIIVALIAGRLYLPAWVKGYVKPLLIDVELAE